MKQLLYLCFLVIFAAFEHYVGTVEYHGNRRFYTAVKDNKTFIALNVLKEPLQLIFPNDITFDRLASGIELYSPSNGQCKDTTTLQFWLEINVGKYIRGEIKLHVSKMMVYLFEKCGGAEKRYTFKSIGGISASLKDNKCFKTGAFFQSYGGNGENVMKLRVSGTFGCQVFMILPEYMHIKDSPLNEAAARLPLNETFTGHDDGYWWLNANNESMPSNVAFNARGDVEINVLTSNKATPIYLRIGVDQPVPSFVFEFDRGCQGARFELYLNLQADGVCRIAIDLVQGGFKVAMGASGGGEFVLDSYYSPTLLFAERRVYVKVDTPLTFKSYATCDYSNTTDVARDQLVVQIASSGVASSCKYSNLTLLGGDVARGIEVLRNRSSGLDGENATTTTIAGAANYTVNTTVAVQMTTNTSLATAATEHASFPWWWIIVGVTLLGLLIAAVVLVYIFVIRPRRNKKKARKIRDVSKSAASEEVPPPGPSQMPLKQVGTKKKQSKIEAAAPPPPQQHKEENWAYDPNSRDHPIVQLAKAGKL